jgi:hypothetical protein
LKLSRCCNAATTYMDAGCNDWVECCKNCFCQV